MLARKPRKGDRIAWRYTKGAPLSAHGTVVSVDGNLCWLKHDKGGDALPFIWNFPRDGQMNQLAEILEDGPEEASH